MITPSWISHLIDNRIIVLSALIHIGSMFLDMNLSSEASANISSNVSTTSRPFYFDQLHNGIFTCTHVVINTLLTVIGLSTSITLLARNTRKYYKEMRMRAIGATESQLLTACVIFCSLYLPWMTAEFLGIDFAYDGPICSVLIWIYGSLHATIVLLNCCLSVCWMVRLLWPNINHRTHNASLYIILVFCWLAPALIIGIHIALKVGQYSMPSELLCMSDLDFPLYLPGFVMPIVIIAMTCYTVCFIALREWKHLQYEMSPRVVSVVIVPVSESDALNAHCSAFFMFITFYLMWKTFFVLFPGGDYYTPIALHVSFIFTPLIAASSNSNFCKWLSSPFTACVRACRKRRESNVNTSEGGLPPSYSEIMASQQTEDARADTRLESGDQESARVPDCNLPPPPAFSIAASESESDNPSQLGEDNPAFATGHTDSEIQSKPNTTCESCESGASACPRQSNQETVLQQSPQQQSSHVDPLNADNETPSTSTVVFSADPDQSTTEIKPMAVFYISCAEESLATDVEVTVPSAPSPSISTLPAPVETKSKTEANVAGGFVPVLVDRY